MRSLLEKYAVFEKYAVLEKYKEESGDMVEIRAYKVAFRVIKAMRALWILLIASVASALLASLAFYNIIQRLIETGGRFEPAIYFDLALFVLSCALLTTTLLERSWARIALKNKEISRILAKYDSEPED